ncbi:MAG: single-stranded DNA-binding protein [Minisyncoccia bacterium]
MYLNKAFVVGNLTRDPEMRALPSGIQVASFSVATNRVWKDKNGAKQEAADFHNVVVFGKQAETVGQYLKKGSNVLVEGRMQTRSWETDGKKNYKMEIIADRVQFGPRPSGSGGTYTPKSNVSAKAPEEDNKKADKMDTIDYPTEEINPEDIPF